MAGPDYQPIDPSVKKWASEPGSVYIGNQKVKVMHPRLRGTSGEMSLRSYEALQNPDQFSRDLSSINLFALYLDTIHRSGVAFVVALGLDQSGKKWNFGFWEEPEPLGKRSGSPPH
jgi:hypothetical protein